MDAVKEQQEEAWFDVFVRRGSIYAPYQQVCTEPTEVFTTTYSQQHENGDDIELILRGYKKDSEQTMISSGLSDWESSEYLCKYLMSDEFMKRISNSGEHRLLELGSGLGKCGLLAHNLLNCQSTTVLTDGDTNALHLLRQNVAQNTHENNRNTRSRSLYWSTRSQIYCEQLVWGRDAAKVFLSEEDPSRRYDTIIGSDLLYTNWRNIRPLFETVDELMDDYGCFVLAHNENHLIQVEDIIGAASRYRINLFCEVLKEGKKDDIYVLCFRRPLIPQVNDVMNKLQDRIAMLEIENERLKSNALHMEERNRRLDERCTVLREKSEDDLPSSVLLSLDEDNIVIVASYLEAKDLSIVASTSKVFGGKNHKIGDHGNFVSLMKKIAYKLLYEESLPWEKDALEYTREKSPLFMYDELLQLRKPLKFDKLLGTKIKTTLGDASILQPRYNPGQVKRMTRETFYSACTAVSNYVMRRGRYFVTFKCNLGQCLHPTPDAPLWFGLVRPLIKFPERQAMFTPFSSRYISRLLQLPEWDRGSNCFVYTSDTGRCQWINMKGGNDHTAFVGDWDGMQPFDGDGEIGLLLDYDDGSLTVYKNGVKLGIMAEGLSGPFCWMVTAGTWFRSEDDYRPQIKIERVATPVEETSPSSRKRPRMNREGLEISN